MTQPTNYVEIQHEYNIRGEECIYNFMAAAHARKLVADVKKPPASILDIGCREGFSLEEFSNGWPETRVVGVDIVPAFIEKAQGTADELYCLDCHDLSKFKDGEFEITFTSHTLEHCYDLPRAIAEMKRVTSNLIYCVLPLEKHDPNNPSHYFETTDPLIWANKIADDEWKLISLQVSARGDMAMVLLKGDVYGIHSDGSGA